MTSDVPNTIWALGGTQTRGEHGSRFLPLQDVKDKFNKVALMSLYTLMYKILNNQSASPSERVSGRCRYKKCSKVCWCSFSFRLLTQRNGNYLVSTIRLVVKVNSKCL